MPVYQYKGVHYTLPDGLSNDDALAKIKSHLGEGKEKAGLGTAIASSFANVGNMADIAASTIAGSGAALFGQDKEAIAINENMRERIKQRNQWANPEGQEIGFGGKLAGAAATLPMQVVGMGLSPAQTVDTAKQSGESNARALAAGGIDTAGNLISLATTPMGKTLIKNILLNGGVNAAQDYATKAAIQKVLETEKGQKAFEPTLEDASVSGVIGMGMGASTFRKAPETASSDKLKAIREAQAKREPVKTEEPITDTRSNEQLSKEALVAAIKEKELQKGSAFWREPQHADLVQESPMDRMARDLGGEPLRPVEQGLSALDQQLVERSTPEQWAAQDQLAARQAQMEQDVTRQTRLEMMAAERARQEAASPYPPEYRARIEAEQAAKDKAESTSEQALEEARLADEGNPHVGESSVTRAGWARKQGGAIDVKAIKDAWEKYTSGKNTVEDVLSSFKGVYNPTQWEHILSDLNDPKSRSTLVLMSPSEFLKVAAPRTPEMLADPYTKQRYAGIEKGLKSKEGLRDIPYLYIDTKDGIARVTGHEGRHRMDVFAKKGLAAVPVVIKDSMYRWGENNHSPEKLRPEGLKFTPAGDRPFPLRADKFVPKGQRGGLNIEDIGKGLKSLFGMNERVQTDNSTMEQPTPGIPANPKMAEVLTKALAEKNPDGTPRDGKTWNLLQSGGTSTAMKTGSAAIKAAADAVQNGMKRAGFAIKEKVFPAEDALRKLSKQELLDLHELLKDEVTNNKRFDGDILASNLSVKQLEAYVNFRNMLDDTMAAQNAVRVAKGQTPITAKEAYLSHRWQGDFRRPVYDKKGKLVWYLAANTRLGIESQTKALLKKFPDLVIDKAKDHVVRSDKGKTDLQSMYSTMLDILGRDDPAIEKIRQAIEDQTIAEGESVLGQTKHFKSQSGVRGYVGDRPGLGIELKGKTFVKKPDPAKEALSMFEEQIQYAKNAYTWSEMQKTADDIKSLISSPELQAQQPNNVKYIREYFKNAIGMNESRATKAISDAIRDGLGVSPKILDDAVGDLKSFFLLQKIGVSAGYTVSNVLQTTNMLPYLANLMENGYKGNPVKAVAAGFPAGMTLAAYHYAKANGMVENFKMPDAFWQAALKYAEDNQVTTRSMADEAPISSSFGVVKQGANMIGKTISVPETVIRSIAFMTYTQMLKDSGKFTDSQKLFQKAEEYVNKSMVDYRNSERPMVFSKLGSVGNFMNVLQTYPMSVFNQYGYMWNQARQGKPFGLMTMLATQYAIAGAMGIPFLEDADKLYKWLRDNALPTGAWKAAMDNKFLSDPKLWMMETLGKSSVYGYLSEKTGLGLTSRVQAPGLGSMAQSPVGPITDIVGQGVSVGKAILDPTNTTKLAQAAMNVTPTGLQGFLENIPGMKDTTYKERAGGNRLVMSPKKLEERTAVYERTPEETAMRRFGLRSQKEVVERDVEYALRSANQTAREKAGEISTKYYDAIRRGKTEDAAKLQKLYIELTGSEGISDAQIEKQMLDESLTSVQKATTGATTTSRALNAVRMRRLLEQK